MKIKLFMKQAGCAVLCAAMLTACSGGEAGPPATSSEAAAQNSSTQAAQLGYVAEMNKAKVMSFEISADKEKWQQMLDNAAAEEYIPADVTINGTTVKNVGIRPKGNSSLRQIVNDDTTDRYSFKIKFDEYVKDQTWMGLDKIVVNNMHSDTSYLKEYLSYDVMSFIGVDSPLYAFADIKVNGEAWGFYLAVEDIDSGYLDRTKEGKGELYKPNNDDGNMLDMGRMRESAGAAPAPGTTADAASGSNPPQGPAADAVRPQAAPDWGPGERGAGGGMRNGGNNGVSLVYSDDNVSSYSAIFDNAETKTTEEDHQRVITALKNLNAGTDLEKYIDVDAVLKYFAAHTVVVNMDSYTSNMGHNYYLYENNGRISILPWDYNMSFGGFQAGTASDIVNLAIDTPVSGVSLAERPLLGKLLEVPEYKEKYHDYLQKIVDGYFADGKFKQTVESLDRLISDYVKNDPSSFSTYEEYKTAVAELIKLGTLRAESIQGQLDGEIPATTEGQQADSSKLVDASSIDMAKLGNMGFGNGRPGGSGFGGGVRGGEPPGGLERGAVPQRGSEPNSSQPMQ